MSIKTSLIHKIEEYVREHPGNRSEDGGCYFGAPLVGTASLTDPLFDEYKKIIGPFHWTPAEVLGLAGGCGLCQTDVPCEDQIPDAADPGG